MRQITRSVKIIPLSLANSSPMNFNVDNVVQTWWYGSHFFAYFGDTFYVNIHFIFKKCDYVLCMCVVLDPIFSIQGQQNVLQNMMIPVTLSYFEGVFSVYPYSAKAILSKNSIPSYLAASKCLKKHSNDFPRVPEDTCSEGVFLSPSIDMKYCGWLRSSCTLKSIFSAMNLKENVNCGLFSTIPLGFWSIEI